MSSLVENLLLLSFISGVSQLISSTQIKTYLSLLSLERESPTASYLRRLQKAHIETIPHENLNGIYNFPTSFDLDDLLRKFTTERRGGLCFELNYAFSALLRGLGFNTRLVLCDVVAYDCNKEKNRYPTHPVIVVEIDGAYCITDVGWSDSYREPLTLTGELYKDGSGEFRVFSESDHQYVMQKWLAEKIDDKTEIVKWHDQFRFAFDPHITPELPLRINFLAAHCYTQVAPDYLFSTTFKFSRIHSKGHVTIWNDGIFKRKGDQKERAGLSVSRAEFLENDLQLPKAIARQCHPLKRTVSMTFFDARMKTIPLNDLRGCTTPEKRRFSLSAYLQKIGVERRDVSRLSVTGQLSYLNEIFLAHIRSIPFHNFELLEIGRQHPVARSALCLDDAAKIFTIQNGGYCFQTTQVLYQGLKELGFNVKRCLANILHGLEVNSHEARATPASHVFVVATIKGQRYMVDPNLVIFGHRSACQITEKDESTSLRFHRHAIHRDYFVFETRSHGEWFRVMSSQLIEATDASIEEKLCELERYPHPLGIRDQYIAVSIATDNGYKKLSWNEEAQAFDYEEDNIGEKKLLVVKDLREVVELLRDEFHITHISPDALKRYCAEWRVPTPKRAWTTDFPFDQSERDQLAENLRYEA